MICIRCGVTTAIVPCEGCGADPTLAGRYHLEAKIGSGASGVTYRGVRIEDKSAVAIKERVFAEQPELKSWERFEREWRVLRELHHPNIPAYVEHVEQGEGRRFALYIVTDLVDGPTLQAELETKRYNVEDAVDVAVEILEILDYLHRVSPPVVHRDIKPSNIMRDADGQLKLVDFGSVRASLEPSEQPTMAGTYGFMAPEQLRGESSPASDLYGVGALLVALLSREDPANLHTANGLEWRSRVAVEDRLADVIDGLLDHDPSARPTSAVEAVERLRAALKPGDTPERALLIRGSNEMVVAGARQTYVDRLVGDLFRSKAPRKAVMFEIRTLMKDEVIPASERRAAMAYAKHRYQQLTAPARRRDVTIFSSVMVIIGSAMALATMIWGSPAALFTALLWGGGIAVVGAIVFVLTMLGVIRFAPDDGDAPRL